MENLLQRLNLGGSTAVLIAAMSLAGSSAMAQDAGSAESSNAIEEVVVTGSSIRGIAPVGSNLITVSSEDIEATGAQTMDELFKSVPSISQMGAVGQGTLSTATYYSPNIHQLGGSSANSTLVILNGLRLPLGGTSHSQTDPSIIPTDAIERVDVLATGASSIYGSDAVAGVVNFITRKSYDGLQVNAQYGLADGYSRYSGGLLWGTSWNSGNVMLAYEYSNESSLANNARSFLNPNQTARALTAGLAVAANPSSTTDFNNFNCDPATVQPNGSGNIYLSPTSTTSVANTPANSPCNSEAYGALLPKETRNNVLLRVSQNFSSDLTVHSDIIYAYRADIQSQSRGTLTATAFQTGPQANPFYVNPPGVTATKQTIRWDADELLGPGAYNAVGATTFYANTGAEYHFGNNFVVNLDVVLGQDRSYSNSYGKLCSSCANEALNGTTNTSGSTTTVSIPGTTTIVTTLPLTAANALDVWNPAASNQTSAAELLTLTKSTSFNNALNSFQQFRLGTNGSLFSLPGGDIRVAAGAELVYYSLRQQVSKPDSTGPASIGSSVAEYDFGRSVQSFYGELEIPVVGDGNSLPLVQKFDVDISGRYDHYSDVGPTANPKFALNWEVTDGLTLRGNYSTSFVAPQMDSVGDPKQGYLAAYGGISSDTSTIVLPVANFPQIAGALPGCATNAVTCTIGGTTTPGLSFQQGGGKSLTPATGDDWSVTADFAPTFLPGFDVNATLFDDSLKGAINSPTDSAKVNARGLNYLFTVCPSTCSAAQVGAVLATGENLNTALPSPIYFLSNGDQENVVNLRAQGIDFAANYDFDTDIGHFKLGETATVFLTFDEAVGRGAPYFSVLNQTGFTAQFPGIQTQSRSHLGWSDPNGVYMIDLYADFTGSYRNWSSTTVAPVTHDANGNPSGGGDKVDSSTLIDLHLAYNIPDGILNGDSIYFDATNIFDWSPPYYNSSVGYDAFVANPIGRVLTIGVRAKL